MAGLKNCSQCGPKPVGEFGKDSRSPDGLKPACKTCRGKYRQAYRYANAERLEAYNRKYRDDNAEHIKVVQRDHYLRNRDQYIDRAAKNYQDWKQRAPEECILRRLRGRSKQNGIVCTITVDDITIPAVCPVLGIPLYMGTGKGPHPGSPSVDRLNPSGGYEPGNVRVISHRANTLKNDATVEELELVLADLRRLRGPTV